MSKAVSSVAKAVTSPITSLFGGGGSPGALGTGRFQPTAAQVDKKVFQTKIADQADPKQSREIQQELTNMLLQRAKGEGTSLAELQLRDETDRQLAQLRGALAGQVGRSGALGQRQALRLQAETGQQAARSGGILRAQEQLGAQAALAQQIAQQREQDVGVTQFDLLGPRRFEELKVQQAVGLAPSAAAGHTSAAQQRSSLVSGIGSALAGAGMLFSDKNLKKDIKSGDNTAKEFIEKLKPFTYKYKDEKYGKGGQLGIMAQDLEKAGPTGKSLVIDTPEGKAIDTARGFGAALAAMSEMNQRLNRLESKKSRKGSRNGK